MGKSFLKDWLSDLNLTDINKFGCKEKPLMKKVIIVEIKNNAITQKQVNKYIE